MEIVPRGQIPLRPAWRAQVVMDRPDGWIVHWVGSGGMKLTPTLADSSAVLRSLQEQAANHIRGEDYSDIEYNFAVDPVGRIFELRGWTYKSGANGSANYNGHAWAVVYLGGPGMPLTAAAKEALLWLTQEGARRNPVVSYVRPHSRIWPTACPGDELRAFCSTLEAQLHNPQPKPAPAQEYEDMMIQAPAWQQHDPNAPACASLDIEHKHVNLLNGAQVDQDVHVKSATPIRGWYELFYDKERTKPRGFVVVAARAPGSRKNAAFTFTWKRAA